MKRVLLAAVLALALLPSVAAPRARGDARGSGQAAPFVLRALTFNIHHAEGNDRRIDLARVAEAIRSTAPDLVALQEVDQGTTRAGGVRQLDSLAVVLGMHGAFGKAMDYSGGEYGVGVLSRWPIEDRALALLPSRPENEQRAALTVWVRVAPGAPLLPFTSTHFDNTPNVDPWGRAHDPDRISQASAVNEWFANDPVQPAMIAGDFNAQREPAVMNILAGQWTNATLSAGPPPAVNQPARGRGQSRADYVLVRPSGEWRVIEARTVDAPGVSDHRPVLAVLEWTPVAPPPRVP